MAINIFIFGNKEVFIIGRPSLTVKKKRKNIKQTVNILIFAYAACIYYVCTVYYASSGTVFKNLKFNKLCPES